MRRFEFAKNLALEVSSFLVSERKKGFHIDEKAYNDYVTESDKKAEEMIRKKISEAFPDDEILGEEYGISGSSSSLWIVDPIDGTVDYMNSFPLYTVSIAYSENDEILFGVVAVPEQNELFYASKGEGAYLNGKKISISSISHEKALAILVPPHRIHTELDSYLATMRKLYEIYSDVRSLGSAAVSLCYLSSGRVSCYYERFLHIYDIAAGVLIAAEAGAMVDMKKHGEYIDITATVPSLFNSTREVIYG